MQSSMTFALLASGVVLCAMITYYAQRYIYPMLLAGVLAVGMEAMAWAGRYRRWVGVALLLVAAGFMAPLFWPLERDRVASIFNPPEASLTDQAPRYWHLFDDIPAGERILTRLDKPYLCKFSDHEIYLADWPGGASPPPGMPMKDSEKLAHYLAKHDIRYIAWSYANQAGFPFDHTRAHSAIAWRATTAFNAYRFADMLEELRKSRLSIYDDGQIAVLDLESRKEPPSSQPAPPGGSDMEQGD
jgi:hypothetical protein